MLRSTVIALYVLAAVLTVAPAAAAQTLGDITAAIDNGRGSSIEGVWQLTRSGAVIAVTAAPDGDNAYDVRLLEGNDPAVPAYTLIGRAVEGAEKGCYDITLKLHPRKPLSRTERFIVRPVSDRSAGRMRLSAYRQGLKVDFRRLIPYLFRVGVRREDTRPADHDGMVRLYPPTPPEHIVL